MESTDEPAVGQRHVRLSINLSPDVATTLRAVAARHGLSVTDTVRRAVAVLDFVDREMTSGGTVTIVKDGLTRDIALIWD